MKKIIILAFIIGMVLVCSVSAFAFENIDSDSWQDLDQENKAKYLEGVIFGMNFFMINLYSEFEEDIDPDTMAIQLEKEGELIQPGDEEYNDIISKVDQFFKENPRKDMFDMFLTGVIG